jgi:hypothetical protein
MEENCPWISPDPDVETQSLELRKQLLETWFLERFDVIGVVVHEGELLQIRKSGSTQENLHCFEREVIERERFNLWKNGRSRATPHPTREMKLREI